MKDMLFGLMLVTSVGFADPVNEKFHVSCQGLQSDSEESLSFDSRLTITRRPSTGTLFGFDFRILSNPLPYQAKAEINFGDDTKDDSWVFYFINVNTSENLGTTKASLGAQRNEVTIETKLPESETKLTFSCVLERL